MLPVFIDEIIVSVYNNYGGFMKMALVFYAG
jgi:hypothetical protein